MEGGGGAALKVGVRQSWLCQQLLCRCPSNRASAESAHTHSRRKLGPVWWLSAITYVGRPLAVRSCMHVLTALCWLVGRLPRREACDSWPTAPGRVSTVSPVQITTCETRTGGVRPVLPVCRRGGEQVQQ